MNSPCLVAMKICSALDEGRRPEAKKLAIEYGRNGYHSEEFSKVLAELLVLSEPQPGMEGRPQNKFPSYWYEIGIRIEELRSGLSYEEAEKALIEELMVGLSYEKAVEALGRPQNKDRIKKLMVGLSYEKAVEALQKEKFGDKIFSRNTITEASSFYKKSPRRTR